MSEQALTGKKILVVDDEPDVCTYLSRLLADHGYQVTCAADGNEAMQAIEKDRPDLISLDLSMPHQSGVRFYRDLKASPGLSDIPVIFVTGITGPGGPSDTEHFYRSRSQMPPPDAFVAKPIDPDEMLALVKKLLAE